MWIARPVGTSSACAGREHERRVDAGAQVEAGAAGGRVGRQLLGDARIEDADVDVRHGRWRRLMAVARPEARRDLGDQAARQRELVGARQLALAASRRPA